MKKEFEIFLDKDFNLKASSKIGNYIYLYLNLVQYFCIYHHLAFKCIYCYRLLHNTF